VTNPSALAPITVVATPVMIAVMSPVPMMVSFIATPVISATMPITIAMMAIIVVGEVAVMKIQQQVVEPHMGRFVGLRRHGYDEGSGEQGAQ
jgi:hypothetical protein